MSATMTPGRLDGWLTDYFRPGDVPVSLVDRLAAAGRPGAPSADALGRALVIQATERGVSLIRDGRPGRPPAGRPGALVEQAREEIAEYLRGERVFFSVPVDLGGVADFQRRVLEAAREIPFGEGRSYAWIAERIGHPRAVRAVGTALGRNPVPLVVPCHRVWKSDGALGHYLFGADVKRQLARLERQTPVLEGSTATRIVCRVGCAAGRRTRLDQRVVFASVDDARSVGYRPCAVCRPGR